MMRVGVIVHGVMHNHGKTPTTLCTIAQMIIITTNAEGAAARHAGGL